MKARIIASVVSLATIISSGAMMVLADGELTNVTTTVISESSITTQTSSLTENFLTSYLTVDEVIHADGIYTISATMTYEPKDKLTLTLSGDTIIVDNQTGLALTADKIITGSTIIASYGPELRESYPVQADCRAIVANIEEGVTPARYMTVANIEINKTDSSFRITSADGGYIITINKNTPVIDGSTGKAFDMQNIKRGMRVFPYFDVMLLSYPAQAGAIKMTVMPALDTQAIEITDRENININGEIMNIGTKAIYVQDGLIMLPVRTVFEKLGFTVGWMDKDGIQSVTLDNGIVKTTVTLGKDLYYKASSKAIGLTQSKPIGAAPVLVNDKTYVPANLVNLLYSNSTTVSVVDGMVCINTDATK